MKVIGPLFVAFIGACGSGAVSSGPTSGSPVTGTPASAAERVASARARLADPSQEVRDAAASELRATLAAEPALAGGTEATWQTRLASIKPGTPASELAALLGATEEGALGNGTGLTLRLDDAWTVIAEITGGGVQATPVPTPALIAFGPLQAASRQVWVAPPDGYTGPWVTYFASGQVASDIEYAGGTYARFTARYDNGQESYTQRYVGGVADGPEVGYHRDGSKAYAIQRARGENVGTWTHWYPSGQKQSEETYVAGKLDGVMAGWRQDGSKDYEIHYKAGVETGQAAWDAQGKRLYAHGTAATP